MPGRTEKGQGDVSTAMRWPGPAAFYSAAWTSPCAADNRISAAGPANLGPAGTDAGCSTIRSTTSGAAAPTAASVAEGGGSLAAGSGRRSAWQFKVHPSRNS